MRPDDPHPEELEPLLAECLARMELEGKDAIERVCEEHPASAAALRAAVARLHGWGLAPSAAPHAPPRRLGDFEIRREIGRGGMGVVYEAEQLSLRRTVALKVLPAHLTLRRASIERFQREALAAARLKHPSIVEVLAVGTEADVHYFAMELVRGTPLDRAIERKKAEPADTRRSGSSSGSASAAWNRGYVETVVRMTAQVADALEHAHRSGVIHRDVKPSNVIVRDDGTPVLTDFGLAREEGLPSLTETGEFAGTPYYVSPEQAMSRRAKVDHRTDVFSLGVTLYELLTLERPFRGETRQDVLAAILTKEPADPQKRNPRISGDLGTIVLKAIEKEPDRRYATAGAMADDLRAFLEYRPIAAKRATTIARIERWARREPWKAALAGVLVAAVPTVAALAGYVVAKRPEMRAAAELARHEEVERQLAEGFLELGEGSLAEAERAFESALAIDPASVEATAGAAQMAVTRGRAADALEILSRPEVAGDRGRALDGLRAEALRAAGRDGEAASIESRGAPPARSEWLLLEGAKEMRRGARGGGKDAFARSAALLASAALTSPRARPVTHFMLAFSASRAGDEVAARRCADAISALWPDSSRAWLCVGIALQRFDRDRSTSALRRAVELDPRSALAHDALGEALYESGDHAGAMAELVRAVELRPGLAVAHVTIGTVLRTKGDLPGAMASYRRAVSLDPMLASAHGDLGAALNDSRDFAGAAAECRRAIELDASMAPAHHNLGVSLFELGDVSGALAAYRRAIALDPSLALAHSGEGRCLEAAGDDAGALAAFRRAVELDRNVADAHAHVGDLLAKRGDFPAAIRSYRRAIELGESGAGVHEHLADALRRSGDEAGAKEAVARSREALERETRRNAGDAGAWNELAWFLVDPEAAPEQRDPRAALPAARKSVELSASDDPNLPNRLDTLAEALFATGDAVAAVAAEERAVAALDRSHVRNEPLRAGFVRSLARYRGAGDGDASRPRAEH